MYFLIMKLMTIVSIPLICAENNWNLQITESTAKRLDNCNCDEPCKLNQ